jgi:penicillin-binding protein 1A
MALKPRQTGSSIKMFVLAAALQAGAQPNDIVNGTQPCTMPDPGDPNKSKEYKDVAGSDGPVTLERNTWLSLDCGYLRLSLAVGLNRVVDTVYRLATSPYFYRGQSQAEREPFKPLGGLVVGNNAMSPLDMASGAQTIANDGLHHEPYYVESIERADGTTMYTHTDPGTQVIDAEVAHSATSALRGVLTKGTARPSLAKFPFPAAGKTGTQDGNTNSWFVGYTPQLTTAVWVGDPNGHTDMTAANVPEFAADLAAYGVKAVQGGTYPARIWGAYTEPAIRDLPVQDFPAPPAPKRPPVRIFLPGEECPYQSVSGALVDPKAPTTTAAPTTTLAGSDTGTAGGDTTPTTVARVVIRPLPVQTTVPPEVLDPLAPFPTVPLKTNVIVCADIPGNAQVLKPKASTP